MSYKNKYYRDMRNCKDKKQLRLRMVLYAEEKGIKASARYFGASPNTVRKWHRRYKVGGRGALEELSKAPKNCKRRIPEKQREKAIEIKRNIKTIGARRAKAMFNLSISDKAILKIWREEGLLKRKRKKPKTKKYLREIKKQMKAFEMIAVDTKVLRDIPEYYPQMINLRLPKYQYTARDVSSGWLYEAYSEEATMKNSCIFIEIVLRHLKMCGVKLEETRFQTDNGGEFIGSWNMKDDSAFTKKIEEYNAIHQTIPARKHTWQADVETAHRLVEDEFFEIEEFDGRRNFIEKASSYCLWFNVARKNSGKEYQTPWDIIRNKDKTISPTVCVLKPLFLDSQNGFNYKPYYLPKEGHHVIRHPLGS